MPEPGNIRLILLTALTVGYAVLALCLTRAGLLLRYPAFFSYLILLSAKGAFWIGWRLVAATGSTPIPWFRETESIILAVKCLVVLEAWWAVARHMDEQSRRWLFLALLGAATVSGAGMAWLPMEPNPVRAYVRQTLKLDVGLGVFCAGACLTFWRQWEWMPEVPRRAWQHGLVLTGHVLARWTDLIPYHSRATVEERALWYWCQQGIFLSASLLCVAAWWFIMSAAHQGPPIRTVSGGGVINSIGEIHVLERLCGQIRRDFGFSSPSANAVFDMLSERRERILATLHPPLSATVSPAQLSIAAQKTWGPLASVSGGVIRLLNHLGIKVEGD